MGAKILQNLCKDRCEARTIFAESRNPQGDRHRQDIKTEIPTAQKLIDRLMG
jgi:hypothetical protein